MDKDPRRRGIQHAVTCDGWARFVSRNQHRSIDKSVERPVKTALTAYRTVAEQSAPVLPFLFSAFSKGVVDRGADTPVRAAVGHPAVRMALPAQMVTDFVIPGAGAVVADAVIRAGADTDTVSRLRDRRGNQQQTAEHNPFPVFARDLRFLRDGSGVVGAANQPPARPAARSRNKRQRVQVTGVLSPWMAFFVDGRFWRVRTSPAGLAGSACDARRRRSTVVVDCLVEQHAARRLQRRVGVDGEWRRLCLQGYRLHARLGPRASANTRISRRNVHADLCILALGQPLQP